MSPFFEGALGAAAAVLALSALRRLFWFRRMHHFRRGGRAPLRFLYRRLGTRPEQEAVLTAEAATLLEQGSALRADLSGAREELAALFSKEALDAAEVSTALDKRLARLGEARAAAAAALVRVHAALDPAQRATLAAILLRGPHHHHHRHGGPFGRGGHGHAPA